MDHAPERLRRVLLGTLTALLVASPLVRGADPGRLWWSVPTTEGESTGLVLTLLWFVTAVGWAVWRLWTRDGSWGIGAVAGGLLVVAALMFLSALETASYQNPAFLGAWEWLALWLAFCLVRQLARAPGENRRLLAALVASGVSLSALALHQQHGQPAGSGPAFTPADVLAGYLTLLLPAGVGWAWVCRRGGGWRTGTATACALLLVLALVQTGNQAAALATVLAGGAAALFAARRRLAAYRGWIVAGLIVTLGATYVAAARGDIHLGARGGMLLTPRDAWSASVRMLNDPTRPASFWLGVGPDNFSRYYPRYMRPDAHAAGARDPHNFALEVWTSCGVFGVAALLLALLAFFRRVASARRADAAPDAESAGTRWEFYLGGMVGLTLGFVLWAVARDMKPGELIHAGVLAGARSALWFAVYALLESVPWPGNSRAWAGAAGVAALLLYLMVAGGISVAAVAVPMWGMMALALNALGEPASSRPPRFVAALAPLPLTAFLALAYLQFGYAPVAGSQRLVQKAFACFASYEAALAKTKEVQPARELPLLHGAHRYLRERILKPLNEAAREDRTDAQPPLLLAEWLGKQWHLKYEIDGRSDENVRRAALVQAQVVTHLDPEGLDGYLSLYRLNALFATRADADTKKKLYAYAARALAKAVDRAPYSASLRYQLAETHFLADDKDAARGQAEKALELDRVAPTLQRKLQDSQRRQARNWLGLPAEE